MGKRRKRRQDIETCILHSQRLLVQQYYSGIAGKVCEQEQNNFNHVFHKIKPSPTALATVSLVETPAKLLEDTLKREYASDGCIM